MGSQRVLDSSHRKLKISQIWGHKLHAQVWTLELDASPYSSPKENYFTICI